MTHLKPITACFILTLITLAATSAHACQRSYITVNGKLQDIETCDDSLGGTEVRNYDTNQDYTVRQDAVGNVEVNDAYFNDAP